MVHQTKMKTHDTGMPHEILPSELESAAFGDFLSCALYEIRHATCSFGPPFGGRTTFGPGGRRLPDSATAVA
jgi:hypothetical protein